MEEIKKDAEVIVIGAGAAGLMAGYQLVKAGKQVLILEARERLGGRIHTIRDLAFEKEAEAGAEFIHGNLEETFQLLKEAGIRYQATEGRSWMYKDGVLKQGEDMIENWDLLLSRVKKIQDDLPLSEFLKKHIAEPELEDLRASVRSFVEGYDAADLVNTSTLAMREAWLNEDQWDQYRSDGGYIKLIDFLADTCRSGGGKILLSKIVKEVRWTNGEVHLLTSTGETFTAKQAIVTVPLGVLQAEHNAQAAIHFSPGIPDIINAAKEMGYGAVIKVLFQFDHAFWSEHRDKEGNSIKQMSYLFTECFVPTWWTQFPAASSMLTGWLGGPKAAALKDADEESIRKVALETLSEVFDIEYAVLKKMLIASRIFNWTADPFALGAYAYNTLRSAEAKKILTEPVEGTLFFAGEALGEGNECATVEVALKSGKIAAARLLVFSPQRT